ncbi:MAG TPA: hypothetical protein VGQ51_12435 [Puia sp.]|jgi:hypothetical protein|nr:hypothetical protein [Puia sp.]
MKQHRPLRYWAWLFPVLLTAACKKDPYKMAAPRAINYILYTEKDFSNDHDTIRFEILMRSGSKVLLDSPLAPMTIAQIPDSFHRIMFQKFVPSANQNDDLVVGFLYQIDNVGMSWFLDSSKASGPSVKTVTYSFE